MALGCLFLAYMGAMTLFWNGGGLGWLRKLPVLKTPNVETANLIETGQTLHDPATVPNAPSQGEATSSHKVFLKTLLSLWGINNREPGGTSDWPSKPDGTLDVRLVAARHGLEADLLTGLSWSDIKTIGLPGILHWDGEAEPYLLIGLDNGSALLVSPAGKEITRSISELETKPIRSAWFLWRNRDGWSALPTHEWSRRRVTVFAARLHELGYLDYPLPSTYDQRISRAVHRFQQKNRLAADGILGARTAMVLDRLTDRDHIPQLIKGNAQ